MRGNVVTCSFICVILRILWNYSTIFSCGDGAFKVSDRWDEFENESAKYPNIMHWSGILFIDVRYNFNWDVVFLQAYFSFYPCTEIDIWVLPLPALELFCLAPLIGQFFSSDFALYICCKDLFKCVFCSKLRQNWVFSSVIGVRKSYFY